MSHCHNETPTPTIIATDHQVACHLYQ